MWRILVVVLIIITALLPATSVKAETSDTVTITAYGIVGEGISNFVVTYVSDNRMDLSWSLGENATAIMIRAKYGKQPENIPDQYTPPYDGYLVYSGNGTFCSDTSMDFDLHFGKLYYVAWAERADGTWFTNIRTAEEVNPNLAELSNQFSIFNTTTNLFVSLILLVALIIVAFWQRDMIVYIISGIITILLGVLWIDDYAGVAITLWGLGVYQLYNAIIKALGEGTPARGLSQFKAMFRRRK